MLYCKKILHAIDTYLRNFALHASTLLRTKYGLWFVGFISYVESALPVPLITDPFLIIYIIANHGRVISGVLMATVMSVAGGVTAFTFAAFFQPHILSLLSPDTLVQFEDIVTEFQAEMFVVTILGAITPVPYTLVALAAGFVEGSLMIFIVASIIGRGSRYALVGYVTHKFGIRALGKIRQQMFGLTLVTVAAITVYVIYKLLLL